MQHNFSRIYKINFKIKKAILFSLVLLSISACKEAPKNTNTLEQVALAALQELVEKELTTDVPNGHIAHIAPSIFLKRIKP